MRPNRLSRAHHAQAQPNTRRRRQCEHVPPTATRQTTHILHPSSHHAHISQAQVQIGTPPRQVECGPKVQEMIKQQRNARPAAHSAADRRMYEQCGTCAAGRRRRGESAANARAHAHASCMLAAEEGHRSPQELDIIGVGAEGGRSLLGVARGVLRFAPPCGRALPICEFCGRALPMPVAGRAPFVWLLRLPFSLRAEGGRLLWAALADGRGVGVFGRPLLPGRGVGVLRVGLRAAGVSLTYPGSGIELAAMVSAIVVARLRGGEAASTVARTPRCEFHARD
mmetsp:Transcript_50350/g.100270  ORF Transcript_50350/g.100270 Transcript_50350/m.100270 type:complete len:282 (-) Transcript_50350:465-1310(-)